MNAKLISDEKLEGIAIGLKFGLENDQKEIKEKYDEAIIEINRRKHKID